MSATTYNFRVRATHAPTGTQSERDFSVTVREDQVANRLIATDAFNAYTSADGVNWVLRAGQGVDSIVADTIIGESSIAFGGGTWIAFVAGNTPSTNNFTYRTSTNGVTWTNRTLSLSGMTAVKPQPLWLNNRWVIFYQASTGRRVATSFDAITWTDQGSHPATALANIGRAAFHDGQYVVVYSGPSVAGLSGWRSTDLRTWAQLSLGAGTASFGDILYVNGGWFFVDHRTGTNPRILMTTNLRAAVTRVVTPTALPASTFPQRIVYGNGRLLLAPARYLTGSNAAYPANVWTSDDFGLTWTSREFTTFQPTSGTGRQFIEPTFLDGWFYLVATGNVSGSPLRVSRDAVTWSTPVTSNLPTGALTGFARGGRS